MDLLDPAHPPNCRRGINFGSGTDIRGGQGKTPYEKTQIMMAKNSIYHHLLGQGPTDKFNSYTYNTNKLLLPYTKGIGLDTLIYHRVIDLDTDSQETDFIFDGYGSFDFIASNIFTNNNMIPHRMQQITFQLTSNPNIDTSSYGGNFMTATDLLNNDNNNNNNNYGGNITHEMFRDAFAAGDQILAQQQHDDNHNNNNNNNDDNAGTQISDAQVQQSAMFNID